MNDEIKSNSTAVSIVKEATHQILDGMENGSRMQVQDLIDKVIAKTMVKISIATYLVPIFARDYPGVEVYRGRNGGVYKGGKKIRQDMRPRCGECGQVKRPSIKEKL